MEKLDLNFLIIQIYPIYKLCDFTWQFKFFSSVGNYYSSV